MMNAAANLRRQGIKTLLALLITAAAPAGAAFPAFKWSTSPVHPGSPPAGSVIQSGDVTLDPSGNLLTTLTHTGSTPLAHTLKLTPSGTTVWNVPVGGFQVLADASGNVVLLAAAAAHRISPEGNVLWSVPLSFTPVRAAVAADGSVYVCGSSALPAPAESQLVLQKLTTAGTVAWTRSYSGSAPGPAGATALTALPDGGIAVGGFSREGSSPTPSWLVLRYSAAGAFQWSHVSEPGSAMAMTQTGGEVVCAGQSANAITSPVVVKRFNSAGSQVWRTSLSIPLPPGETPSLLKILGIAADTNGALCTVFHHSSYNPDIRDSYDRTHALWLSSAGSEEKFHLVSSRTELHFMTVFPAAVCSRPGGGFFASAWDDIGFKQSRCMLNNDGTLNARTGTPPGLGINVARSCIAAAAGPSGYYEMALNIYDVWEATDVRILRYSDQAEVPLVISAAANSVLRTSAVLNGSVNTLGSAGEYWFEYGSTTAYGSTSPHRVIAAGNGSAASFQETISGLTPGGTYHFRMVASTAAGTVSGQDFSFTTPVSPWGEFTLQWFGAAPGPGSGLEDDPDGDGLANFVEHALGTSPLKNNGTDLHSSMWVSPSSGIPYLSIVYQPVDDIIYTPEASNSLQTQPWSTSGIEIIDVPGGKKRAIAKGFQHFLRLRLTYNP